MLTWVDAGAVSGVPWRSVTAIRYTLPSMWPSSGAPSAGIGSTDTPDLARPARHGQLTGDREDLCLWRHLGRRYRDERAPAASDAD